MLEFVLFLRHSYHMTIEFTDTAATSDVPDTDCPVHAATEQTFLVKRDTENNIQMTLEGGEILATEGMNLTVASLFQHPWSGSKFS